MDHLDHLGSGGSGNTRRPPLRKNWPFTLNNYTEEHIKSIIGSLDHRSVWKYTFQEEIGEEKETPHLQGFVQFNVRKRATEFFGIKGIHFESKMRKSAEVNHKYCRKLGAGGRKPGGRMWTNYEIKENPKLKCLEESKLYDWQKAVVDLVKEEPDDRTVHWFWENVGNRGKSALVRYLVINHGAIVCAGKASDMKYMIVNYIEKNKGLWPRVIIMDIPRSVLDYVSYTGLEEIKNGLFASSKYEGQMVVMNPPHLICFANEAPRVVTMSEDRWNVVEL